MHFSSEKQKIMFDSLHPPPGAGWGATLISWIATTNGAKVKVLSPPESEEGTEKRTFKWEHLYLFKI